MDTRITQLTRAINPMPSESGLTKPQSLANKGGVESVLEGQQKEAVEAESKVKGGPDGLSQENMTSVVTRMNAAFQNEKRSIQFSVDDVSGRTVIKVVDRETGDEIKQIPSEEVMAIARRLAEQEEASDLSGMLLKSIV